MKIEDNRGPIKRKIFNDLGADALKFDEYFNGHMEYIQQIQSSLNEPLDDAPGIMDAQARDAEANGVKMKSILAWADSYLDVAEHVRLTEIGPRSSDFTDMDREIALKAATARERRFRDVVRGIAESIQARVSYTQTRLRTFANAEGQKFQ